MASQLRRLRGKRPPAPPEPRVEVTADSVVAHVDEPGGELSPAPSVTPTLRWSPAVVNTLPALAAVLRARGGHG